MLEGEEIKIACWNIFRFREITEIKLVENHLVTVGICFQNKSYNAEHSPKRRKGNDSDVVSPVANGKRLMTGLPGETKEAEYDDALLVCKVDMEPDDNDELVSVDIGGFTVEVIIDSGSSINAISQDVFDRMMGHSDCVMFNVRPGSKKCLWAYASDAPLKIEAVFESLLWIDDQRPFDYEEFVVISGAKRCLLSKNTAKKYRLLQLGLKVGSNNVNLQVYATSQGDSTIEEFPKFNLPPVELVVNQEVKPRRNTYTCIPPGWINETRARLEQQVKSGIIERVTPEMDSRHCSSMLAVPKGSNDFRIVIDLRNTNKCIIREPHRMPTFDSVMAKLEGSSWFSTIDLTNAFHHIVLHENSRHLTNFWSGGECFRFIRLPFGLCNAPDIFQEAMEKILSGCEGVEIYLDDILVYAKTKEEHDARLSEVLKRLKNHSVKLNEEKCKFGVRECTFLGFRLSEAGYKVTNERVLAIKNFKTPSSIAEVRSFIGLMNYVDRYIINRAEKTSHLQNIIRSKQFHWTAEANEEFEYMRNHALNVVKSLGFYNSSHETELIVDASPIGLGAVLVQFDEKSIPRIIACASKALSQVEGRYSQTQKEALAVVWATERFRFFLHGIKFRIVTDSEANEYIFGEEHRLGRRAVSRAEAWALRLQSFNFEMVGIEGCRNIADVFSRLIQDTQSPERFNDVEECHMMLVEEAKITPLSWMEISEASRSDPEVINIRKGMEKGEWEPSVSSFKSLSDRLSVVGGVLIMNDKLFVPTSLRNKALEIAHRCHFGMESMKRTIRDSIWWPKMWKDVERLVKDCVTCTRISRPNTPIPLRSRVLPDLPMQNTQVDFLSLPGCGSEHFFTVADTYSRMLWCIEMKKTDSVSTIRALNKIFAIWGRPDVIQSDNGPPFNSTQFTTHWKREGIVHRTVCPYSPFMNGLIERQNEGIIKAVKCAREEGRNWRDAIEEYLMVYNNERPQSTTGVTPFELMAGRKYRGYFPSLSALRNNLTIDGEVRSRDETAKSKSTLYADKVRRAKESDIKAGDWVFLADKNKQNKLSPTYLKEPFQVINRVGPGVLVRNADGTEFSRWVSDVVKVPGFDWLSLGSSEQREAQSAAPENLSDERGAEEIFTQGSSQEMEKTVEPPRNDEKNKERPGRVRKAPAKLDDYHLFNIFG